jgi:hypothetical protein
MKMVFSLALGSDYRLFAFSDFHRRVVGSARRCGDEKKRSRASNTQHEVRWINPPSQEQLIEFVRALAVRNARRDHERATNPKKKSRKRILTPPK